MTACSVCSLPIEAHNPAQVARCARTKSAREKVGQVQPGCPTCNPMPYPAPPVHGGWSMSCGGCPARPIP